MRPFRLGRVDQEFWILDFETTGIAEDSDPIEIGIIICDSNFNVKSTYETLIKSDLVESDILTLLNWKPEAEDAYEIHGISAKECLTGKVITDVALEIMAIASKKAVKPVLVSDNIQFEWKFMKKILDSTQAKWPFHYCGWDTSLFLEACGIGDPTPAHRALADAGLLHTAIVNALYKSRELR